MFSVCVMVPAENRMPNVPAPVALNLTCGPSRFPPRASYFYPTRGVGCSPSNMMTSFVDFMLHNMSLMSPPQSSDDAASSVGSNGDRMASPIVVT